MKDYNDILEKLRASGNLRSLPDIVHRGKWIEKEGQTMLNLSPTTTSDSRPGRIFGTSLSDSYKKAACRSLLLHPGY